MKEGSNNESEDKPLTLDEVQVQLRTVQKQFKQAVWAGSIALTALSGIGLAKLSDIESKAREKVDSAVTKGVEYFDLMSNGQSRMNASAWSSASTFYEQALALRPDDEFIFTNLLICYASGANVEAGLKLLESADRSGMLVRKFSGVWTQLNAARLYMIAGVKDGKYIKSAEYHFDRAERAAQTLIGGELSYVLYSEGIFWYLRGDEKRARSLFQRMAELDPRTRRWPEGDRAEPWFQHLLKVQPTLQSDLENLFEVKSGG
jgi:tetratricopeptide (TPR) repeat protein